jgi:hypothetical protein
MSITVSQKLTQKQEAAEGCELMVGWMIDTLVILQNLALITG